MTIHPYLPAWIIVSVVLMLTAIFTGVELKRPFRFKWFRVVAVCLMMFALLAILLRPFYMSNVRQGMLLLTPMYDKKSVDSIISKNRFLYVEGYKRVIPDQQLL